MFLDPPGGVYRKGTFVTLIQNAAPGHEFLKWEWLGANPDHIYTESVTAGKTFHVDACFSCIYPMLFAYPDSERRRFETDGEVTVYDVGDGYRYALLAARNDTRVHVDVTRLGPEKVKDLPKRTISGKVVSGADRPVVGASVSTPSCGPDDHVTLDDGEFSCAHSPEFETLLTISAKDHATAFIVVPAGHATPLTVPLRRAVTIEGSVAMADSGDAVSRGEVFLHRIQAVREGHTEVHRIATAQVRHDGTFSFQRVAAPGDLLFYGDSERLLIDERPGTEIVRSRTHYTLPLVRGGSISGSVYHAGTTEPAEGVPIVASAVSHVKHIEHAMVQVETDDSGRYCITGLSAGSYYVGVASGRKRYVDASQEDSAGRTVQLRRADFWDVRLGEETSVSDLEVRQTARISGRVTTVGGTPIQGVNIYVDRNPDGRPNQVTGPSGLFELWGYRDGQSVTVYAQKDGYVLMRAFGKLSTSHTVPCNISLGRESLLQGVLVDESDQPLPYHHVTAEVKNGGLGEASTDAEGRFLIRGLMPGHYGISVRTPEYPLGTKVEPLCEVPVGYVQGDNAVKLVLQYEGRQIRGRILDTRGRPVPDPQIHVLGMDPQPLVETNPVTGQYRIMGLGDGAYTLAVFSKQDSYERVVREAVLAGSGEVDFSLRPYLEITGRVVDRVTDEPVEYFLLGFCMPGSTTITSENIVHSGQVHAPEGKFGATCVHEEDHMGFVYAEGYIPFLIPVLPGQKGLIPNYEVRLTPNRTLKGRVLDEKGAPVTGAIMLTAPPNLVPANQERLTLMRTGLDGRYEFITAAHVPSVFYWWHPDSGTVRVVVPVGAEHGPEYVHTLSPRVRLEGRVTQAGVPVAGACVTVGSVSGAPAWTDPEGRFSVDGLPADKEVLVGIDLADPDLPQGGRAYVRPTTVGRDTRFRVTYELPANDALVTGYLTFSGDGREAWRVTAIPLDAGDFPGGHHVIPEKDGYFRLSVPAGRYLLQGHVTYEGSAPDNFPGAQTTVELDLEPGEEAFHGLRVEVPR